ncbi:hypothetical protein JAAARDRAFT_86992, partial [Jaapia argillacea MUCL 33604]
AWKCKNPLKGLWRYQDSKDKSSTSNLKSHVIGCFGAAAIDAVMKGDSALCDGSIFSAFARQGQCPVTVSHCTYTNAELMMAGRPHLSLPSSHTVSCNILASFKKCHKCIKNLLVGHPGQVSFGTDAWASPNHRPFVAWTIHLKHEGHLLSFILDIIEVPEV